MDKKILVWIFQTGEPLPLDGNARAMRAINLSNALVASGHHVVLWSSDFYHQEKIHRFNDYKKVQISDLLEIRLIPSPGYEKNVGFARLFDHMVLATNLKKMLGLLLLKISPKIFLKIAVKQKRKN